VGESYILGGQTFSAAGQYAVPLTSATGCDSVALLNLTVQQPAQINVSAGLCPGGSYVFGNQTLVAPGIYQDTFGCDSVVTLTLSLLPVPQPEITGAVKVCEGATATLTAQGNFASWLWSGGESGATVSAGAGAHSVTVTAANGCEGSDTFFVAEIPPVEAVWDTASPLCHGGAEGFIELAGVSGGVEPFVFQLNNGAVSDSAFFQNLAAGTWQVTVTDSAGCETAFSFELPDPPALAVELGTSPLLKEGEAYAIPVQISQSGQFDYAWSPPQGLSCADCPDPLATPLETTTYMLFLENENGCSAQDSVTLRVQAVAPQVYAPNIFSPNGDSFNDFFTLFGDLEDFAQIEFLRIYDRWGGLMFEGRALPLNDEQRGWDGTWRGKKMLPGVYTWLAEIRLADGGVIEKSGEVTLLR
jgi:gliding motility-associated-like protein